MSLPADTPFEKVLEPTYLRALHFYLFKQLHSNENLLLSLNAERSHFVRINQAKVRQCGIIEDALLNLTLTLESSPSVFQQGSAAITLSGIETQDQRVVLDTLGDLQSEVPKLPPDPFAEIPKTSGMSEELTSGSILGREEVAAALLEPAQNLNLDLVGIYAAGPVVRAIAHSGELFRFFKTQNFSFDFSTYTLGQRALKKTLAGKSWDQQAYQNCLEDCRQKLSLLERPAQKIKPGVYRAYLEPAAVSDLITMFSWQGISEAAIRQGESPLRKCREEGVKFSNLFSFSENFSSGEVPQFNEFGELAPLALPLVEKGKLVRTLVSSRTAKEYGILPNGANLGESLRSPVVSAGHLTQSQILKKLDRGLYLSNLHYLNWSDQVGGRVTGMTRYACFWVENGELKAPIENMRFDDTIFNLLGDSLEAVTNFQNYLPEVHTYQCRNLGGITAPGMIFSKMTFTL